MDNFYIKEGYRCNLDPRGRAIPFDDDERSASVYQVKVYRFAASLIRRLQLQTVLDIGCGLGLKLKDIIYPICKNIVGIDREHAIRYCSREHKFGQWRVDDIENPGVLFENPFDLIIAADVIEHLVDPDRLLEYVKKYAHPRTCIVLSTPERDAISGRGSEGPPANRSHVREWNRREFKAYLHSRGLQVIKQFMVSEAGIGSLRVIKQLLRGRSIRKCQVVLCRKNH